MVTVNDFLAGRDADWMGRIYRFHGMTVGKILTNDRNPASKKAAYAADITYGTNNEFGFDYLRDNMKFSLDEYVQRGHHFAIVDEVDSILVDEARTPLIISGPVNQQVDRYRIVDGVVPLLQAELDYVVDEKSRSVALTDGGVDKVEEKLGIGNLYETRNMEVLHHVNQALKAHTIFKRDRDYVVLDGKVVIVDDNTGRLMPGRRWSDGLHQAVEAKEKVNVEQESQTYATITFQNYFRLYEKLAGMTGTAETEREEFLKIYNLDVCVVPTNKPVVRKDHDDVVYKTQAEKFRAILDEIEEVHAKGQPILVGTVSVEKSEIVSRLLQQRGIEHQVLNARNHEREAQIVAQAGHKGAVTISTNMAGRGTDIKLGGDPEAMAKNATGFEDGPEFEASVVEFKKTTDVEKQEVLGIGGLHIIGTERHESRRIDNQLRGRAGRQGDPGSSRFYMALEDDLLRIFQGEKLVGWMEKMGLEDDEPIEHRWINRSIENAQKKVEGHNFNIRKNLLEYDDVMNLQRRSVYDLRRRALEGEKIREMVVEAIEHLVDDVMDECIQEGSHPEQWDIDGVRERIGRIFGVVWEETDDELRDFAYEEIRGRMTDEAVEAYEKKEEELDSEELRRVERMLLLQHTDSHWKDHLLAMDRLRDGIGLRGYGQRNPLLEYKREGTDMFRLMNSLRDEAVVSRVLRMELQPAESATGAGAPVPQQAAPAGGSGPVTLAEVQRRLAAQQQAAQTGGAGAMPAAQPQRPAKGAEAKRFALNNGMKRNDPCPCGSGMKFKKCCYKVELPEDAAGASASPPVVTPPEVAAEDPPTEPTASSAAAVMEEEAPTTMVDAQAAEAAVAAAEPQAEAAGSDAAPAPEEAATAMLSPEDLASEAATTVVDPESPSSV